MSKLKIAYTLLWIIPALAVMAFWLGWLGTGGALTPFAGTCYIVNTLMILAIMLTVYAAIKWFSIKSVRKSIESEPSQFTTWQMRRTWLLLAAVMVSLAAYYLTLDDAGIYCALITLVAATMCYPQKSMSQPDKPSPEEK